MKCDYCGKEYNQDQNKSCPNCGPLVGAMQVGGPSICMPAAAPISINASASLIDREDPQAKEIKKKLEERLDIGKQYFKAYYAGEVK